MNILVDAILDDLPHSLPKQGVENLDQTNEAATEHKKRDNQEYESSTAVSNVSSLRTKFEKKWKVRALAFLLHSVSNTVFEFSYFGSF